MSFYIGEQSFSFLAFCWC